MTHSTINPWATTGLNRCPDCKALFEIGFGGFYYDKLHYLNVYGSPPLNIEQTPVAGDLTVCPWCGAFLRFALHRRVHKLERVAEAEFEALSPVVREILQDVRSDLVLMAKVESEQRIVAQVMACRHERLKQYSDQ